MNKIKCRKNNRLPNFDYSTNGIYFVTICTKDKEKIFWDRQINNNQYPNCLSEYGKLVYKSIEDISLHYSYIKVGSFAVMPNHVHLLLEFEHDKIQEDGRIISAPTKSLSTIVGQFKRNVTKNIGKPIWQKSFYDHIIRDEDDLLTKWNYIENNPTKWDLDEYY